MRSLYHYSDLSPVISDFGLCLFVFFPRWSYACQLPEPRFVLRSERSPPARPTRGSRDAAPPSRLVGPPQSSNHVASTPSLPSTPSSSSGLSLTQDLHMRVASAPRPRRECVSRSMTWTISACMRCTFLFPTLAISVLTKRSAICRAAAEPRPGKAVCPSVCTTLKKLLRSMFEVRHQHAHARPPIAHSR